MECVLNREGIEGDTYRWLWRMVFKALDAERGAWQKARYDELRKK